MLPPPSSLLLSAPIPIHTPFHQAPPQLEGFSIRHPVSYNEPHYSYDSFGTPPLKALANPPPQPPLPPPYHTSSPSQSHPQNVEGRSTSSQSQDVPPSYQQPPSSSTSYRSSAFSTEQTRITRSGPVYQPTPRLRPEVPGSMSFGSAGSSLESGTLTGTGTAAPGRRQSDPNVPLSVQQQHHQAQSYPYRGVRQAAGTRHYRSPSSPVRTPSLSYPSPSPFSETGRTTQAPRNAPTSPVDLPNIGSPTSPLSVETSFSSGHTDEHQDSQRGAAPGYPYHSPTSEKQESPSPKSTKRYSFIDLPHPHARKRPRRRYDEIERLYSCNYPGCMKSYGTLNHLNAHVTMQKHGVKRTPQEFKEMRKHWRRKKQREAELSIAEATAAATGSGIHLSLPSYAQSPRTQSQSQSQRGLTLTIPQSPPIQPLIPDPPPPHRLPAAQRYPPASAAYQQQISEVSPSGDYPPWQTDQTAQSAGPSAHDYGNYAQMYGGGRSVEYDPEISPLEPYPRSQSSLAPYPTQRPSSGMLHEHQWAQGGGEGISSQSQVRHASSSVSPVDGRGAFSMESHVQPQPQPQPQSYDRHTPPAQSFSLSVPTPSASHPHHHAPNYQTHQPTFIESDLGYQTYGPAPQQQQQQDRLPSNSTLLTPLTLPVSEGDESEGAEYYSEAQR